MKIISKIIRKFFKKKFLKNYHKYCSKKIGKALLYHKTAPFIFGGHFLDFSHTNNWEICEMAKILNRMGYVVDVIDVSITPKDFYLIKDDYDIFIGLGVGDSGKYFSDIAERLSKAIKILYAMGTETNLSNKITKIRHDYFRYRHPDIKIIDRRVFLNVNTERLYLNTDSIITLGNEFTAGSYFNLGKPVYLVNISTHPKLSMSMSDILTKNSKTFIYFGGNGNIRKGLDLVIEVFAKHPDLTLYIGAPRTEKDFNDFADKIIEHTPNIHWVGFMNVNSKIFNYITSICGYVILPSSSEGCATSITTCMRRGCVPVVTKETGIPSVENFGFLIPDGTIESVESKVLMVSSINQKELNRKILLTYDESFLYTQAQFSASLEKNLYAILHNNYGK